MRRPLRAEPPLHLLRLARAAPGEWVALPGGPLRVLWTRGPVRAAQPGWLVCLSGEAVLDLPGPQGDFVRLRPGEGYALGPGEWGAQPLGEVTLLLVGEA